MADETEVAPHERWARFRFSVIGPLLAAPPERGELGAALRELAARTWRHPIQEGAVRFGVKTLERWYYQACHAPRDPVAALRRRVRKDAGRQHSLSAELRQALHAQHRDHPGWSAKLHADNLVAWAKTHPELGPVPSYATLRRYLRAQGLERVRRGLRRDTPGTQAARARLEQREVRSFESAHVHGLWHLDYHHGSLPVLTDQGRWERPLLLGVLDDCSRLVCHAQWYLQETAQTLVHGLSQALMKRGLPRALMSDNGSAMLAEEVREGLLVLGIVHAPTLPYSPYQNAKQEVWWGQVEGRLLAMLEGVKALTLAQLNQATLAWVEQEYQRSVHRELGVSPLERFLKGPDVGRPCPDGEALRRAFRMTVTRTQRKSDGTLQLGGQRFEIPSRFATLTRVQVRYARWDLGRVDLVDVRTGTVLAPLYPLDKTRNATGLRRTREMTSLPLVPSPPKTSEIAPLLQELLAEHAATGLPPAYVPLPWEDET
jgi:transposase InsO family protein